MFKTKSLLFTAFSMLTAYMGRAGLLMYAIDPNDQEVKDLIKQAVEDATAGLSTKNAELLKEVKELRKGKQVSPEDLAAIQEERDTLQQQLDATKKELKAATTNMDKLTKDLASEQGFTTKLLADNGLTDQLTKAGVTNPISLKAAKAMLGSQVQIVTDGDQRVAKVGDKTLADFVGEWAKSDEGKHFVAAPNHSGGGAGGGSGGADGTKAKIDGSVEERAAHFAQKFPDLNKA
jgi:hypothetical protein